MSQKEKYLNSAQKFLQKGQVERAIKDYEQVVAADPKDVRHRQKLAELLARCNRNEDACREYETIARYYEDNGFYLKAIAVYKQVQKLNNGKIELSITLAGLNEKLGLVGNALSEYKCAYDYYEKAGLHGESRKVLEKMRSVDPENADILLKLAETHLAAGQRDDAYREYTTAANLLKDRGNESAFEKVCARIHDLFPEKQDLKSDLLEGQIDKGTAGDILPALKQMLEKDERNLKLLTLYAEACKNNGDMEGRKYAWDRILQYFPSEVTAKEGFIECIVEEGDLEEGLGKLGLFASDLISAGKFASMEKFYTTLQNQAPYDTRILQGLKSLYEASGDQAKLADVQVSLNILSADAPEEHSLFDVIEENEAVAQAKEGGSEFDFSWDNGIDLTVSAEMSGDSLFTENRDDELDLAGDLIHGDLEQVEEGVGIEPYTLSFEEISSEPDVTGTEETGTFANTGELNEESFLNEENETLPLEEVEAEEQNDGLSLVDLDESLFEIEFEETDSTDAEEEAVLTDEIPQEELFLDKEESRILEESDEEPEELPVAVLSLDNDDEPENTPDIVLSLDNHEDHEDAPVAVLSLDNDEKTEEPPVGVLSLDSGDEPERVATFDMDSCEETLEEDSFLADGMLSGFKEELESQLDKDDTETHFNLGIAYKEMGLYDEAINEFRVACADPLRAVDCVILHGICLKEKGDLTEAEEIIVSGISQFGTDPEKVLNLKYELALLYENSGRMDEALRAYREIFSANPSFRDTAEKIAKLHGSPGIPDFSDIEEFDFELKAIK
jgi:pilus assembly protein FimV